MHKLCILNIVDHHRNNFINTKIRKKFNFHITYKFCNWNLHLCTFWFHNNLFNDVKNNIDVSSLNKQVSLCALKNKNMFWVQIKRIK